MAHWAEHIIMDGVAGVLPDISLVVSVVLSRGKRLDDTSIGYRIHRHIHSYPFLLCAIVLGVACRCRLSRILMRHLLLDFLTHDRNWIRYGYSKLYRQQ